jgi:hypothetical protein
METRVVRTMEAEGDRDETYHDPVVIANGHAMPLNELMEGCVPEGDVFQTLVCPWPEAEDGARLAPEAERLRTKAAY